MKSPLKLGTDHSILLKSIAAGKIVFRELPLFNKKAFKLRCCGSRAEPQGGSGNDAPDVLARSPELAPVQLRLPKAVTLTHFLLFCVQFSSKALFCRVFTGVGLARSARIQPWLGQGRGGTGQRRKAATPRRHTRRQRSSPGRLHKLCSLYCTHRRLKRDWTLALRPAGLAIKIISR